MPHYVSVAIVDFPQVFVRRWDIHPRQYARIVALIGGPRRPDPNRAMYV
jgi:hypothetical protein